MDYLYQSALSFHKVFVAIFLLLNIFYFWLSQRKYQSNYIRDIRLFLPLYYTFLAFIFTTGSVILPIFKFQMSFGVVLMIVVFIYFIAINIVCYKKFKAAFKDKKFLGYKKLMQKATFFNVFFILIFYF